MNLLNKLDLSVITGGACFCIFNNGIVSKISHITDTVCRDSCCKQNNMIKMWINSNYLIDIKGNCTEDNDIASRQTEEVQHKCE